jgi:hypothetical protein
VDRGPVAPAVEAEESRGAARRVQQVQQRADRRRLAGSVRPEKPDHLARLHGHRKLLDASRGAVALRQVVELDDGDHGQSIMAICSAGHIRVFPRRLDGFLTMW